MKKLLFSDTRCLSSLIDFSQIKRNHKSEEKTNNRYMDSPAKKQKIEEST